VPRRSSIPMLQLLLGVTLCVSMPTRATPQAQLQLSRDYIYAGERLLASVGPELSTVSFVTRSVAVSETAGSVVLTVRVTTTDGRPTRAAVNLSIRAAGGTAYPNLDFGLPPAPSALAFPMGTSSGTAQDVAVPILDDCLAEADEWFEVTASTATDGSSPSVVAAATVTIVDDDTPLVSFDAPVARLREDGAWLTPPPLVRVTAHCDLPAALSVGFVRLDDTTQGAEDVILTTASPIPFAAGTPPSLSTASLSFTAVDDAIIEGDETLRVQLLAGSGYRLGSQSVTTLTIQDNDVSAPLALYRVAPCRLADTRNPSGPLGGPALSAGVPRTFQVAGNCNVPTQAKAVMLVLAVITPPSPPSFGNLRVFETGTAIPQVSVLNFGTGDVLAGGGHFLLDPQGRLDVMASLTQGSVNVVLDVVAYFQ